MTKRIHNPALRQALGDGIIRNPKVVWNTVVHVPCEVSLTWTLLSRLGLRGEGGAGYFLPKAVECLLPPELRSITSLDLGQLPAQRELGDLLRDVPKGSFAEVVRFDDEARIMVLESHWPTGLHYTWAVRVSQYSKGGAVVLARARIANPRHPALLCLVAPRADQWVMKVIARGVAERISPIASFA